MPLTSLILSRTPREQKLTELTNRYQELSEKVRNKLNIEYEKMKSKNYEPNKKDQFLLNKKEVETHILKKEIYKLKGGLGLDAEDRARKKDDVHIWMI